MTNLSVNWNLNDLYASEKDALSDFELIKQKTAEKLSYRGKLNSVNNILKFYKLIEELSKLESKLLCYLSLRKSLNGKDVFARELESRIEIFNLEVEPKLAFITPELLKNKASFLNDLAKREDFKDFDQDILDLVQEKKHILPEKIDAILSQNPAFGSNESVYDCFNDVDLKFGSINVDGKEIELTHGTYGILIKHKDEKVRREAFDKMHKAYADFNYTLGELYLNDVKESCFFNKIHKYKNMLEVCCKSDKTTPKVLNVLIETVNENLERFYEFERIKQRYLKINEFYSYDNYLDVGKVDKKFNYEESVDLVLESLKVLGGDYVEVLKTAFASGWIDVYEKPAKTSGGFCLTVYGNHPYVLLNHNNTYNAVSTIAHELGHAMHGYYSINNQPIFKSGASIFVCEVASIVNEILLVKHMINNSTSDQEKLYYIHQLLSNFYSTIYRQTMFSEFEHYVYQKIENNEVLIVEDLNKKYDELQKKYFGEEIKLTEYAKYEWSRIPHFYRPYYVYKYATGFISAFAIANNILSGKDGYVEKYKKFLSAGSSVKPIDLLKMVDVDITKKSTLNEVFKLYQELISEFKNLTKEK